MKSGQNLFASHTYTECWMYKYRSRRTNSLTILTSFQYIRYFKFNLSNNNNWTTDHTQESTLAYTNFCSNGSVKWIHEALPSKRNGKTDTWHPYSKNTNFKYNWSNSFTALLHVRKIQYQSLSQTQRNSNSTQRDNKSSRGKIQLQYITIHQI